MDETSTTDANNQSTTDSTSTDQQTDSNVDNLDTSNQDQNQSGDDKNNDSNNDGGTDTPATLDDDIDEWISKRGFTAETDEQKQSFQKLRNEQREFTRAQQAKKDSDALADDISKIRDENKADDDDDEDDEYEKRFKALEADREAERNTRLQSEFYTENKVSDAEHKVILDLIKEKVARESSKDAKLRAIDLWGHPNALPDLLDLAKARISKSADTSDAEEAARQAERDRIAQESNATSTKRGAKTVTTGDKTPEQQRLERFTNW